MATTTTVPQLVSAAVIKSEDGSYPWVSRTVWRGKYLVDGSDVELIEETQIVDATPFDQDHWDTIYARVNTDWTALTGNTTPFTNPIVIP